MPAGNILPAFRELLAGLIDYAGLFPPAKLPMDAAVANYARFRGEREAWMLGRFVCPVSRLAELSTLVPGHFAAGPALSIAALGRGGANVHEFLANLRQDLADIAAFRQSHGERVVVDVLETKLPPEVVQPDGAPAVARLVGAAAEQIETLGPPTLMPYFEAGLAGDDWQAALLSVFEGLYDDGASDAAEGRERCAPAGFKLRTGGLEAAAFPSVEQVAFALAGCRKFDLSLKFTAGLHHPVRLHHASVQTKMHGFLNMVLAALFAYATPWPASALAELLAEENPANFHVHEDGVGWRNHALDAATIHRLRQEYGFAFGSCSFDEPRDDLRALGWL